MQQDSHDIHNTHEMYTLLGFYPVIKDILSKVIKTEKGYIIWLRYIKNKDLMWLLNVVESSRLRDKIIEVRSILNSKVSVIKIVRDYDMETNTITIRLVPHSSISIEEDRLHLPQ